MTLLVSWVGVDTHGTSSIYICSDSRVTWEKEAVFDYGRKVFAFSNYPDILGYSGDVLFPSIILGQIVEMVRLGLLFQENSSCKQKFEIIKETLIQIFNKYPQERTSGDFQMIHASREPSNNKEFFCHQITWKKGGGWSGEELQIPLKSGFLTVLGTGRRGFLANYPRYEKGPNKDTTRNIFHCFCDTLFGGADPRSGGAPQMVSIYRKPLSTAKNIGIIKDKRRYFLGAYVPDGPNLNLIEWRNDLFELCDGETLKRLPSAQSQPNPLKAY